ncbi:baculoviral IAP repeat-containing protein 7-like isoform X2 [Haliotis cracherodii]|uniref:baculoviral IAP repeat-containing protein 7-like isoform X2 n=1 Tax=Haliotis cracherodii TaxID=6455 RepID=UPI0039E7972F
MNFSDIKQLHSEADRLQTFEHWPLASAVNPQRLAKAGFYYIGPSDRVRCVFCYGILKSWLPNDDPETEHRTHFPDCPFLQGREVGNVPMPTWQAARPRSLVRMESIRFPAYDEIGTRLESVSRLPRSVLQDRQVIAEAGFFYTGFGDSVKCFSCGGALRNWQKDDDPWIEHARWFPRCPYVRQQKGNEFVDDIEANFRNAVSGMSLPQSPQREHPIPDRRHEVWSPMIQAVVESGYSVEVVQRVLLDLKRLRGPNSQIDVQSLMEAVMRDQEEKGGSGSASQARPAPSGTHWDPEDRIICKICMEREVEVTFQPCGHLVCCEECTHHIQDCPVCRRAIRSTVRTYLA